MEMTIQQLARLAKGRIKTGYWQQECNLMTSVDGGIDTESDKAMYEIVASIMESDEIITNPLSKLVDKDLYNSLSDEAKSRYMLELSRQYVRMAERYSKLKDSVW